MSITFTAHCVKGTFSGRGESGCFHSFDWRFKCGSYERAQISSTATIYPRKSSLSFCYRPNKAIVAHRKFHEVSNALQVRGNPEYRSECGAQFCDILRLPLVSHVQFIGDQHRTGKQGVELCCSPRGFVLYGGCSERHPCLLGTLWPIVPLCDMAKMHRHMLHAVPENILVYYVLVSLQFLSRNGALVL